MIIVNKYLVPKGMAAITLFPFIIFKDKSYINWKVINHEKIHIKQQIELLVIGFYILYICEYLINLMKTRDTKKAYHLISLEREAYYNDSNLNYLENRKVYSFTNYF